MTLSLVIVRQISPIIQDQLDRIQEENKIFLDAGQLTIKDSDSDYLKSMKQHLLNARQKDAENLGQYGAKIIGSAIDQENELVRQARALRKQADEMLTKAHKLHNSRSYLLETGDVIPIAIDLGLVPSTHVSIAQKHVDGLTIPDAFAQTKQKKPR